MKNAKVMAEELVKRGYGVISGGTDNHCMLIDLRSKDITGKDAENLLVTADITVNKNMVPFDDKSPFVTSGIRVGTAAVTTRGVKEEQIIKIVALLDKVIMNRDNQNLIEEVKNEVNDMMNAYPLYQKLVSTVE